MADGGGLTKGLITVKVAVQACSPLSELVAVAASVKTLLLSPVMVSVKVGVMAWAGTGVETVTSMPRESIEPNAVRVDEPTGNEYGYPSM